jgi:hypothetical protein
MSEKRGCVSTFLLQNGKKERNEVLLPVATLTKNPNYGHLIADVLANLLEKEIGT